MTTDLWERAKYHWIHLLCCCIVLLHEDHLLLQSKGANAEHWFNSWNCWVNHTFPLDWLPLFFCSCIVNLIYIYGLYIYIYIKFIYINIYCLYLFCLLKVYWQFYNSGSCCQGSESCPFARQSSRKIEFLSSNLYDRLRD